MKKEEMKNLTIKALNKNADKALQQKINKAFENCNLGEQKIYGLYDKLSGFAQVFIDKNDGIVCRNVKSAVLNAKNTNQPSPLADCPENFDIMELVTINNDEKTIIPVMRTIINVKDLLDM